MHNFKLEEFLYITITLLLFISIAFSSSKSIATLSNTALPIDTDGNTLYTGEASFLYYDNYYYLYLNDWGNCSGINCCTEKFSSSCASCCFTSLPNDCVYADGHNIRVYRTKNFVSWENMGIALSSSYYIPGVIFRPHVLYNSQTKKFIMWYEDRWTNGTSNPGYAISLSNTPDGPFIRYNDSVHMTTGYKIGDFDIFIDDKSNIGYHVRTGVVIEQLNQDYTQSTGNVSIVTRNSSVEGPSMFERNGIYYVLVGLGCCACKGGSNIDVYKANDPMGPYVFIGDVGSNYTNGHVFNAYSPYNYVTHAQGSDVIVVDNEQYLWLGNQWVTAIENGNPRNKDLLYWTVLEFNDGGDIEQVVYDTSANISVTLMFNVNNIKISNN